MPLRDSIHRYNLVHSIEYFVLLLINKSYCIKHYCLILCLIKGALLSIHKMNTVKKLLKFFFRFVFHQSVLILLPIEVPF